MKLTAIFFHRAGLLLAACAGIFMPCAQAGSFEVAVSPARFELASKSASRLGQSLDLFNVGNTATEVSVRTLDWTYGDDGSIKYVDELLPQSCRPWVTLERKTVKVVARGKTAFRFQIDIPADARRGECRFMLAIEGVEPAYKALVAGGGASLSLPVNGRIAIAVYLAINGAEPQLELTKIDTQDIRGKRSPVVSVRNTGDAHGRLEGSLDATDGKGQQIELVPEGSPIMPGQSRVLPLTASAPTSEIIYPLKTNGTLDWDGGSFKINAELP
ncbi:MAG TPA: hypothetical protein VGC24_07920 [Burkholderiaceae bacterium]